MNNPNPPTRSKPEFLDRFSDDDTSPVVVLPQFWFVFLVLLCLMETGLLLYFARQQGEQENLAETRTIKVDGGCTIEASAVTVKGDAAAYRLLPIGTPTR
jgi:hypothetical protein